MAQTQLFDDVAFYYVLHALLAVFLVPPTFYYLWKYLWGLLFAKKEVHQRKLSVKGKCKCNECLMKEKAKSQGKKWSDHLTWKKILFVTLWLVWLYLWIQIPNYKTQELKTFKPYEILGLEEGADESAVKKAYRQLSRKYHPDKDPSPEAAEKFRQVTVARDAVIDPRARENMARYGNPDGYQGISVTIGLPSWLVRKENNVPTLLLYFLAFFVILPIGVYYWYQHSSQFAESGVMNNTMYWFGQKLTEQMSIKVLIELMASAYENFVLIQKPLPMKEWKDLRSEVAEVIGTPKFKDKIPYITHANVLWHAYLTETEIPRSLQADMTYLLQHSHKLIEALLNVSLAQKFYKPTVDLLLLSQSVTQGLWHTTSGLRQLPHFTPKHITTANKQKFDLQDFREMKPVERMEKYTDFTPEQWVDINNVLEIIPHVDMRYRYEVEDEDGIYEGDVILLTVELFRNASPELKAAPIPERKKKDEKVKTFEDRLDDLPVTPKSKIKKLGLHVDGEAPLVHSLRFPFPKHERWYVYLVEHLQKVCDRCKKDSATHWCQNCNGAFCSSCDKALHKPDKKGNDDDEHRRGPIPSSRIVGWHKIRKLAEYEEIHMLFRPPVRAKYSYEIHAVCDSYLDCDVEANFKLDVLPQKPEDDKKEEEEGLEDDPEDEEEKPLEAKWYYLYCTSFWEMVGNVVVFIVLIFFFINFLQQRGYWQKYVQPSMDRMHGLWIPIWRKIHPVIGPVYDPAIKYGGSFFHWLGETLNRPVNITQIKLDREQESWDL